MKKVVLMLAVGGLMLATPSCKKGENDPFLSLASRKGRVAGEYTISAYESSSTYTSGSGASSTSTEKLDGDKITEVYTYVPSGGGSSSSTTTTTTLNLGEFTFTKDGTFTMTWNTTYVDVDVQTFGIYTSTTTSTTVETMTQTGSWNFLGKVDEYKNKERLVINVLSSHVTDVTNSQTVTTDGSGGSVTTTSNGDLDDDTYGYSDGENSAIFEIDMLKGKEMVFKQIGGGSNIYSTTSGSTTTTTTSTDTFSSSWTLTQK